MADTTLTDANLTDGDLERVEFRPREPDAWGSTATPTCLLRLTVEYRRPPVIL
ncbi:hypothetical protein LQL77_31050 [Rhodococcus cerastii]|nr:hypothetical protein [Rhodococcus cerastii]